MKVVLSFAVVILIVLALLSLLPLSERMLSRPVHALANRNVCTKQTRNGSEWSSEMILNADSIQADSLRADGWKCVGVR